MFRRLLSPLLCLAALALTPAQAQADDIHLSAEGTTLPGSAIAVLPEDLHGPAPVIFVLHGAFETGARIRAESGEMFDRLGAAHGWVIVYPSARSRLWDPTPGPARDADLRRLDAFLEALAGEVVLDRDRVFATGFSQGAALALDWACTRPGRLRAVAAVSMSLPARLTEDCRAAMPDGVLLIHGTDDPVVPFAGGDRLIGPSAPVPLLGHDDSIAWLVEVKGCAGPPVQRVYDQAEDGTAVTRSTWTVCATGAVEAYAIEGGGHRWPNARPQSPFAPLLGPSTREIDGAAAVFGFFSRFR